jgi:hypothetical protein
MPILCFCIPQKKNSVTLLIKGRMELLLENLLSEKSLL